MRDELCLHRQFLGDDIVDTTSRPSANYHQPYLHAKTAVSCPACHRQNAGLASTSFVLLSSRLTCVVRAPEGEGRVAVVTTRRVATATICLGQMDGNRIGATLNP